MVKSEFYRQINAFIDDYNMHTFILTIEIGKKKFLTHEKLFICFCREYEIEYQNCLVYMFEEVLEY